MSKQNQVRQPANYANITEILSLTSTPRYSSFYAVQTDPAALGSGYFFSLRNLMAVFSKKDKLVEEAQKLALRGQFDKAVKIYEQVVDLEPSAINLRQKLAELLIKAGRLDDARKEFETIGRHFSKNGFYLKAIAVYKQLQKLFPADISLSITLAELNEKHGLTANAISEYRLVYDYHQKSGNTAELLKTLDKMQNLDPQNVPIKIKLAEAYYQHDKKDDSYALFSRTATLLQERGDSAMVSRLNARIQQLFPEKTEFVLEILAEQVKSGNAAKAVIGLQGLLRSNTDDRRVWDLIIEAYRRLDQPQRVKVAYQHYLRYFPEDPVPMIGLISCCAAERDLSAALEQLDRYESHLYSAGLLDDLEKIYRALESIDPINTRILEGLIKVARTAGKNGDVELLSSRLQSLRGISGTRQPALAPEPVPAYPDEPDYFSSEEPAAPFSDEIEPAGIEQFESPDTGQGAFDALEETETEAEEFGGGSEPASSSDEDIEIEIDIDVDSDFEPAADQTDGDAHDGNWLDSVGGLFDTITTSPRCVRFGNEMDNSDAQSHFDLGLAFKEMGLFDEAINEFRQASADTSRRLECLIMQGACLRERGEYDTAVSMLNTLLKPGLNLEDSSAVKYELALAYESAGKTDQATQLLNDLDSSNPGFRDVSSRLNAANLENSLDFSDEELKDFDLK